MKHAIFTVFFVLCTGCGGSTVGAPPPAPTPPPDEYRAAIPIADTDAPIAKASAPAPETTASPPAMDRRPPMQIVVNELASAGIECAPISGETPSLQCPGTEANHRGGFLVVYSNLDSGCSKDDACSIRLISYDAPRAFGTPCEKFEAAMNDLTIVAHHFSVTCNDTTSDPATSQQFGFTTTLTVIDANRPGVAAAVPIHQADRSAAIRKLTSIKAIQAPGASRGPAARKKAAPPEKHD